MNVNPPDAADESDFDAKELEAIAADETTPSHPPEVDPKTENLTAWDEPPAAAGVSAPKVKPEDETSAAEVLVEEGVDEADREQRLASADPDFEP